LQIKNLISIRKNQFKVKIVENTFKMNSAIKGLIYIENSKEISTKNNYVAIYGNKFSYTASFFDASAIFFRHEASDKLSNYVP
jgi:hypothetical protein